MIINRPLYKSQMPISNLPQLIKGYFEGYDHMKSYAPHFSREELIDRLAGNETLRNIEDRRRIQLHDIFEISKRCYTPSHYAQMIVKEGKDNPQGVFDFLDFQVAEFKTAYSFELFDRLSGYLIKEKDVKSTSLQTRYSDYQSALGFIRSYLSNEDTGLVDSKKLFDPGFIKQFLMFFDILYDTLDSGDDEMRINETDIVQEDIALYKLVQLEENFNPSIKPESLYDILKESVRD